MDMNNTESSDSRQKVSKIPMLATLKSIFFRKDTLAFVTCVLVFFVWPRLDLLVGHIFFNEQTGGFHGVDSGFLFIAYEVLGSIQIPILLIVCFRVIYSWLKKDTVARKNYLFLLACLLVGPGILVNLVLKENSTGRPRPRNVVEFGFESKFTGPFEYSGACKKNCSFVSGHSSVGFFLIAIAWVTRQRRYLVLGITVGAAIGLMRMSQGGHFLSDVIFSFWAVYGVTLLMACMFKMENPHSSTESAGDKADAYGVPSSG